VSKSPFIEVKKFERLRGDVGDAAAIRTTKITRYIGHGRSWKVTAANELVVALILVAESLEEGGTAFAW